MTRYARLRRLDVSKGGLCSTEYKAFIALQRCIVCGGWPVEVAHVGDRAFGQKCSDLETLPVCVEHHRTGKYSLHGPLGKNFWEFWKLNKTKLVAQFQALYGQRL